MKDFLRGVFEFLNSNAGLLILGFLVTTVGGTILNDLIQSQKSRNDQNFVMYQTRLNEAKELQKTLLESSTDRSFYLKQIVVKIANPRENPSDETKNFWRENVRSTKDTWNKDLYYMHAQMGVLFSKELASMLLIDKENEPGLYDTVVENVDEAVYEKNKPKSLHGAFVAAHATAYHLVWKCDEPCDKRKKDLLDLALKQLKHLELLHSCLSYRMSGELLRYPYGPKPEQIIDMPKRCTPAQPV
jgi:hypothetical protein